MPVTILTVEEGSSCLSRLLFLLFLSYAAAELRNYCAEFKPVETQGASGYFSLTIGEGAAFYRPYINLVNWAPYAAEASTCSNDLQLAYHIHTYWKNNTAKSSHTSYCAASLTGGHYDPNLACHASSESINV